MLKIVYTDAMSMRDINCQNALAKNMRDSLLAQIWLQDKGHVIKELVVYWDLEVIFWRNRVKV